MFWYKPIPVLRNWKQKDYESEANLCSTVRPCGRRGKQKGKGDKEENGIGREGKGGRRDGAGNEGKGEEGREDRSRKGKGGERDEEGRGRMRERRTKGQGRCRGRGGGKTLGLKATQLDYNAPT